MESAIEAPDVLKAAFHCDVCDFSASDSHEMASILNPVLVNAATEIHADCGVEIPGEIVFVISDAWQRMQPFAGL
jgi:hypothetical protein